MGKKWWFLCIAGVLVLVLIASLALRSNEPVYHGRTLAMWLRRLPARGNGSRGVTWQPLVEGKPSDGEMEAISAVREIGTNALPYLLGEIHTEKKSFKEEFRDKWIQSKALVQRMISRSRPPTSFTSFGNWEKTAAQLRHWDAARGFYALGPLAKPALPELAKLLHQADACPDAAYALSSMGPEGLVPLMEVLTNNSPTNQWMQICVIWAFGQTPTNGEKVLPELLQLIKDPDETLRMSSAWALGQIRSEPEIVVPALAGNLGDTNVNSKSMTERALGEHGMKVLTASALKDSLADPKLYIRMAATNAIRARYPAEAAKLGVE